MSAEASNWAWKLDLDSPMTRLVLIALADIADNEGHIRFIREDYLLRKTCVGRGTFFLHLRKLESGGVFARERNTRGDGSRTMTGQLALGARWPSEVALVAGAATGTGDLESGSRTVESGSRTVESGSRTVESGSRTRDFPASPAREDSRAGAPARSLLESTIDSYISTTTTTTDSSQSPGIQQRPDEAAAQPAAGDNATCEARWSEFLAAYPFNASMDLGAAEAAFSEISAKDRKAAIRAAKIYRADLAASNRKHPVSAARWLKARSFEAIGQLRRAQDEAAGGVARVFVAEGTPAWTAWRAQWRRLGKIGPPNSARGPDGRHNGWYFPTLFPPGPEPTGPPGGF